MYPQGFRLFHIITALFVGTLLISNTIAVKIIDVGIFLLPAGIICFPVVYIINDVLTEVYGYKKAKSVIWTGFFTLGLMVIFYSIATILKPSYYWPNQSAFATIFSLTPRIALGSFLAYLVGSFANSMLLSKMKVWTNGKYLWTRTIGSTIVGEGLDSIVFNTIAFAGSYSFSLIVTFILSGFILKTLFEIVFTPLTYFVVKKLKKIENVDQYDKGESYNLF